MVQRSSSSGMMAGNRLEEITAQARALLAAGRGKELMLMPGWWYVITAESFLDRMENTPDVLALAPRVTCPTLFIRGDKEPRASYPAEEFAQRAGGPVRIEIIPDCDHFYSGREEAVQKAVAFWLASMAGRPPSPDR
jgi:pimeloyl-ACP methyl ester carboxylesterase